MYKTAASSSACLLCDLRSLLRPAHPSWQAARTFAQAQQKRPSRMTLSPNVSKPSSRPAPSGRRPSVQKGNSPFGGMNRTDAGVLPPRPARQPLAAARATGRRARAKAAKPRRQEGDMKALKMQQALSRVSYGHRSAVKQRLLDVESFHEFNLLPIVHDSIASQGLKGLTDVSPTPIQRLAIPALLGTGDKKGRRGLTAAQSEEMQQFLLAAETGSGKTLAYVLPTIDAMKRAELFDASNQAKLEESRVESRKMSIWELESPPAAPARNPDAARPKVVVLQPTSELVHQVGNVFKAFSHTVKFRTALVSAAYSATVIRNRLFADSGIDIVVSTPYILGNLAESDPNILSRVTHLIIDEADSLFDRGFAPLTSTIIDKATPSLKQLIMCSATIPQSLDGYLRKRFPDIQRLATPNLHAIPRRVQLSVVDIEKDPYRGNRDLACAEAIWNIGQSAEEASTDPNDIKRILVFVNEREKAEELTNYLTTKGIDAVVLNRDTSDHRSGDVLSFFTSTNATLATKIYEPIAKAVGPEGALGPVPSHTGHRILQNTKVLVMTDLGSRGIDTVAVRNVILYDVPHTSVDFIHRLGRTGRMGRRGRGIVLVGKSDRKDVVREVREGMFRGQALI